MKDIAKQMQLPPVYTGKWASASNEEVQQELAKGTPYTYRFRVPKGRSLGIDDLIRGRVSLILEFPSFLLFVGLTFSATNIKLSLFNISIFMGH